MVGSGSDSAPLNSIGGMPLVSLEKALAQRVP